MDSSPGFASAACDSNRPVQARFRCGSVSLNLAACRDSQAHSTKGTRSPSSERLPLLGGARFQALFHSPLGVLFTFPSRYWFAIGHRRVFSLGGWSPLLRTGFHVPGPTLDRRPQSSSFAYGALTRCGRPSHCRSARTWFCNCGRGLGAPGSASRNTCEATAPALAPSQVWARALSLAATRAISVDFSSSGYLDVSVPPVVPERMVSNRVAAHDGGWVPPFGNPGIEGRLRLPRAYRGLPRPSSTSDAKASAVRP